MKPRYTILLSMAAGAVVGAAAIQGLHAQVKTPVYFITEIDVKDPDRYGSEAAPKLQAMVRASGAKFVAIGGAGGANAKPIAAFEGTPPKRMTIQTWESMDALKKWNDNADYQAALNIGKQYADFRRYAVEGQQ